MNAEFDKWVNTMWGKFPSGFTLLLMEVHPVRDEMSKFVNSLSLQNVVLEGFPGIVAIAGDLGAGEIHDVILKAGTIGINPITQAFGDKAMSNLKEALNRSGGFSQLQIKP